MVTLNEVARLVVYSIAEKQSSQESTSLPTPGQVQSVYKCIGKFLSYMYKKTHYEQVAADIFAFGTVLRNN